MRILHKDLREFLGLLSKHDVRFVVVGGYAVGVHGYARYTGDLDVFVDRDPVNAQRVAAAFAAFGFDLPELRADAFTRPERIIEIGREPVKIQVLTSISGVEFREVHGRRITVDIDGLVVPFIGYDDLVRNKSATGREKDRVDVLELRAIHGSKGTR